MSYTAEEKRLLQTYLDGHPMDELTPERVATQVHHIFGKHCRELRVNTLNFIAVSLYSHSRAEFYEVQGVAELIFKAKIKDRGQEFIDFANQYGGKTWRVYCEKSLTNT